MMNGMAFTTIYIILTVIAAFLIRIIWLARQNQAYAFFSMHREDARRDLIGASIILMMVLGLMAATFYIQQVLSAPPETPPAATPAPEIAANTPTPRPSPTTRPTLPPTASPTPQPTATAVATATPTAPPPPPPSPPLPLPSPTPNPALGQPPQCANSASAISTPGNGARVNGMVQITGTAFIDDFDYYKFELRLPNGDWAFTMLRQYLFDAAEKTRLAALKRSAYQPVAQVAEKMLREELYHERHTRLWVLRLSRGTEESHRRMQSALEACWPYMAQLLAPTSGLSRLAGAGVAPEAQTWLANWQATVLPFLETECGLILPTEIPPALERSVHTPHLRVILAEMQSLPRQEPEAQW